MARYHATVESRRSATGIVVTDGEDGSMAGYEAGGRPRGPLQAPDPVLRPGFRAVAGRAAAGLAQALSGRPRGATTAPGTTAPSGGAARPGDAS
jgi:hypothetical protein